MSNRYPINAQLHPYPMLIDKATVEKYDVPGPRYTSYPTAPVWNDDFRESSYIEKLQALGRSDRSLSLYLHIPFCRTLCSFCACNVILRPHDEKYGAQYIQYILLEAARVAGHIGKKLKVKQLHWGGGTPTFLSSEQIRTLYRQLEEHFEITPDAEVAIEVDPRTIDDEKLETLRALGFNRISMGLQDFDADVQREVNRHQTFEQVNTLYQSSRRLGFRSINFDLIYGLPKQSLASFHQTIQEVCRLRPDRIALYSFAYVPWLKKHQQKLNPADLPTNDVKLDIFLDARNLFLKNGYEAIAMDHFALADDELAQSFKAGRLYRNFMGYTVKPADEYLGLGVSSIGFLDHAFIQNHKTLPLYFKMLDEGHLPVERGFLLNRDDRIRQWTITQLMCHFAISYATFQQLFSEVFDEYFSVEQDHIRQCRDNGFLTVTPDGLTVTELGKIFVRNICMGFDIYLQRQTNQRFSKTI